MTKPPDHWLCAMVGLQALVGVLKALDGDDGLVAGDLAMHALERHHAELTWILNSQRGKRDELQRTAGNAQ